MERASEHGKQLQQFYRMLAVCHTVLVEHVEGQLHYQASSPDEEALVKGAAQMGFELTNRHSKADGTVDVHFRRPDGADVQFKVHCEFPFDSTRKRMSVVCEGQGRFFLMCKGADSIMFPRCRFEGVQLDQVQADLHRFAVEGLRTLVMAQRELSQTEFHAICHEVHLLKVSDPRTKDQRLADFFDLHEQRLLYLGSSAIEDKLQDQVPETIAKLIESEIKLWVLTGDKQETAIEIGRASQLIQEDMQEIILTSKTQKEFEEKLDHELQQLGVDRSKRMTSMDEVPVIFPRRAIVIDGPTLIFALSSPEIATAFFQLGLLAASVICCRVSPK